MKGYMMVMLFLTGCASTTCEENFLKGVGKKSITEVNNMIEKGTLRVPSKNTNNVMRPVSWNARKCARSSEKILCLWIAPYEDEAGDLHEAQKIHVVVEESRWIEKEKKS